MTDEVPETPEDDSFRALAIDELALLMAGANYPVSKRLDMVDRFIDRRDALLAAEDEHPATPAGWQSVAEQYRTLAMDLGRKLGDDFTHGDLAAWLPADLERMRLQLAAAPVDEHPPTSEP